MLLPARANREVQLIGEIVIAFANLEFFVEAAIWNLLGPGEELQRMGEAITAEMSFDRKVNAFESMYRLKYPETEQPSLNTLRKALFNVQAERNAIVHSAWSYSEARGTVTRMKASAKGKNGLRRRLHYMTPARLDAVRCKIVAAAEGFVNFAAEKVQGGL